MPTIPMYQQQTRATTGAAPALRDVGAETGGLRALSDVAQRLTHFKEQDASADAANTLAKFQSDWQRRLIERQQTAAPDAEGFTDTLLKDYNEDLTKIVATGKTRNAMRFLKERGTAFGGALGTDALAFQVKTRQVHRISQFQEAAFVGATGAELDPDRHQERLAEQLALLSGLDISPSEKAEMARNTIDLYQSRAGVGFARRDPDATLKRILEPEAGDTLFRTMTPKARDAVLNEVESVQRMRLNAEELAYRKAERGEKAVFDATAKTGDELLASGNLTTRWIEQNKDRLDPQDHRYFYSQLSGAKGGPRDLNTYLDLRERVSRGDDVRDEARTALQANKIGVDDYDRLLGEVETSRPGWYERGASFIKTSAGVSDLNPDPAAAQRLAVMQDDWQQWADDHPKATNAEARAAYTDLVSEYQIVDMQNLTIFMRAPKFLKGSRMAPDLEATEKATLDALDAGEISEADAEAQALVIQQWRDAMERQGQVQK